MDRNRTANAITYKANGETVSILREDPFGHWKVYTDKGELPTSIANNTYTEPRFPEEAVIDYLVDKYVDKTPLNA